MTDTVRTVSKFNYVTYNHHLWVFISNKNIMCIRYLYGFFADPDKKFLLFIFLTYYMCNIYQ